jgi:hypothetical protein|tara:strand:+ start:527 stop:820 length:294 start_codon:yes stop_codon:yes gene_type:complete
MTYDASNPEDVARAKKKEADAEKDIDFIASQPRGRRWLYRLIFEAGHMSSQSYVPASFDATAFNEGARSIGRVIHEDLRANNPKAYMQMLEENHFDG